VIPLIIGMCVLNWGLEAAKWHVLANSITKLSYMDSLRGVFCGLALSRIVPGGIGECFGRMGYLNTLRRVEAGALVYFGGLVQFLITSLFGLFGVYHLTKIKIAVVPYVVALTVLVLLIVFTLVTISKIDFSLGTAFAKVRTALNTLTLNTIVKFVSFSICRYVVFGLQLYLLFQTMNLGIESSIIVAGITLIYLAKTIIPTFNFIGDLGIREFSAIFFFSQFSIDSSLVVLPTLVLWLVNILLPSLLGLYFIARARIFVLQREVVK